MEGTITFTKSQRNKRMAIYNNYAHHFKEKKDGVSIWRCSNRSCNSKLKTDHEDRLLESGEHNHPTQEKKCRKLLYNDNIRNLATNTHTPSSSVFTEAIIPVENRINAADLPARRSTIRLAQRTRAKIEGFVTQDTPDIPEFLHLDRERNQFLMFDSGSTQEGRFSIWSSKFKKENMDMYSPLLVDATFKISPTGYEQLLAIHTKIFNRYLPLIYVLMTNRTEVLYNKVFEKIIELFDILPIRIICDFEKALTNSLSNIVQVPLQGCFFHFSQMIWRKIQKNSLSTLYRENIIFKKIIKKLICLAFCREDTYKEKFEEISVEYLSLFKTEKQIGLLHYFKKKFIGISEESITRPPRYRYNFWSSRNSILFDTPYTNNVLEAWNNSIRNISRSDTPNIAYWYNLVLDIETDDQFQITRAKNGIMDWSSYRMDKKVKIKTIIENEHYFNTNGYLEALSRLYSFDF